ncbi:esterase B1 [Drosophila teissieri]|uniref:esterase B1 n=1 Tax=Drosophila teissieri TaxID=7243 RepID=UPI001CBA3E87|nr:esterase B1 [Drosophila teissieri]
MWKLCQPRSRSRIKCFRFLNPRCGPSFERFSCPSAGDADSKVVKLSVGNVKGRRLSGIYGDVFYSFEGIPFAQPPLGKTRFGASHSAYPWNSELDARQERPIPLQMDRKTGKVIGSEDCLYLNVYTKHFNESEPPLPVMVYIYGGAFRTGGAVRSKYGPDYLMSKDVVYVLFNYRLCSLGFLSMPSCELDVPGNAGLHDQLLALQWVSQHIRNFNGDPQNITLFGESAGAASVHFMMCLPQAKGLFHKAIMMSGSMLSPWVNAPERDNIFCRLATSAGYQGPAEEVSILEFLRNVNAEKLICHDFISPRDRCFGFLNSFVPVVGGLVRAPFPQLMKEAWSSEVPLLLGGTSFEGLVYYPFCQLDNGYMLELLKHEPAMVLPHELYQLMSVEERNTAAEALVKFHYGPRGITKNNITQILDLFSYKLFWHGLHRVVLSRLSLAQAPTYLYRFDFDSPKLNLMRNQLCGDDIKRGVCHADDLGYIFHKQAQTKQPLDSPEFQTIQRMVGILTTFARTGDPNCPETGPDQWLPVSTKTPFKVLNIGQQVECVTQVEKDGLEVWNGLYNDLK